MYLCIYEHICVWDCVCVCTRNERRGSYKMVGLRVVRLYWNRSHDSGVKHPRVSWPLERHPVHRYKITYKNKIEKNYKCCVFGAQCAVLEVGLLFATGMAASCDIFMLLHICHKHSQKPHTLNETGLQYKTCVYVWERVCFF